MNIDPFYAEKGPRIGAVARRNMRETLGNTDRRYEA